MKIEQNVKMTNIGVYIKPAIGEDCPGVATSSPTARLSLVLTVSLAEARTNPATASFVFHPFVVLFVS